MRVKDVIQQLQRLCDRSGWRGETLELMVPVQRPGAIGRSPAVGVKSIDQGVDWDKGRIFVQPATPLAEQQGEPATYRAGYDLVALRDAAEASCRKAATTNPRPDGAINWADLHCIHSERFVDHLGNVGHRVFIEEVDPSATALARFIHDDLAATGYASVEVDLEW